MKRIVVLLMVVTVPALLFLNLWQAFRFDRLRREVTALERTQGFWIEENKRLMIGIEVLSSPRRIDDLASEHVEFSRSVNPRELRVRIAPPGRDDG